MLNKTCDLCKELLPKNQFTSMRAKYCRKCLIIHKLEKRNEMTLRSLARTKTKKQKTSVVASIPELKKTAQRLVNKFCRLRDVNRGCISCTKGKSDDGGHFWPMGSNSALRYHEDNINGQCTSCNRFMHGNLLEYRLKLVVKIGEERVAWLDKHHKDAKKWTREELESIISEYKTKIDELS